MSLPVSGKNWYEWAQIKEVLKLKKGDNTIEFKHDEGDSGRVNLDCIMVSESGKKK